MVTNAYFDNALCEAAGFCADGEYHLDLYDLGTGCGPLPPGIIDKHYWIFILLSISLSYFI